MTIDSKTSPLAHWCSAFRAYQKGWRHLLEDEWPFERKCMGHGGPDTKRGGIFETVCPDFDVFAEYEIVLVLDRLDDQYYRAAKQGDHLLLSRPDKLVDGLFVCLCGKEFSFADGKSRSIQ